MRCERHNEIVIRAVARPNHAVIAEILVALERQRIGSGVKRKITGMPAKERDDDSDGGEYSKRMSQHEPFVLRGEAIGQSLPQCLHKFLPDERLPGQAIHPVAADERGQLGVLPSENA